MIFWLTWQIIKPHFQVRFKSLVELGIPKTSPATSWASISSLSREPASPLRSNKRSFLKQNVCCDAYAMKNWRCGLLVHFGPLLSQLEGISIWKVCIYLVNDAIMIHIIPLLWAFFEAIFPSKRIRFFIQLMATTLAFDPRVIFESPPDTPGCWFWLPSDSKQIPSLKLT